MLPLELLHAKSSPAKLFSGSAGDGGDDQQGQHTHGVKNDYRNRINTIMGSS